MKKAVLSLTLFFLFTAAVPARETPVVLVRATPADEARYGALPWPRSFHANLIARLELDGVEAVVLGFLFDAPTNASADGKLAAVCEKNRNILVPFLPADASSAPLSASVLEPYAVEDRAPGVRFPAFAGARLPFEALGRAAAGIGSWSVDEGGKKAPGVPLLVRVDGKLYPSLALMTALRIRGYACKDLGAQDGGLKVGEQVLAMDAQGRAVLKAPLPKARYKVYGYGQILNGDYREEDLAGSLVILGRGGEEDLADAVRALLSLIRDVY